MKAYEFSTNITPDKKLVIPQPLSGEIPPGKSVRVIVLIGEDGERIAGQDKPELLFSVDSVVQEIRNTPQSSENVQPASGLLAEHLANSPESPDPSFDVVRWNRAWDQVEAEMKAAEVTLKND